MKLHFKPKVEIPYDYLITIDPSGNGTTGLCIYNVKTQDMELLNFKITPTYSYFDILDDIEKLVKDKKCFVVMESFILYKNTAKTFSYQKLHTSEFIGSLKQIFHRLNISWKEQSASVHKMVDNKYLKLYYNTRGLSTHQKDTMRILIFFLKSKKNSYK